ncbi:polyol transporter 1 [Olea europaea subsp. europaea]|uniref:Polyol transporter 1 n=2 Tax=Olea europaea subsp. europaea TaxID=158383 RepID=A0A8S0SQE5_OLEEU|nr:polyol transporter 1 [Olea europaea subsp. europaea]
MADPNPFLTADHNPERNGSSSQSHLQVPDLAVQKKPKRNMYALACSILASMTSVLLGYDTGVMSGATIYIKKDLGISDVQIEILVGTINIYALVGSAVAGRTSDWIGRRYTIIFASAIFFIGALLMGLATNYAYLMVGRFVAGIGVGYALMIAPVYAAEVSPAASRGFLTSFPEVFITFGVLLGYVANYAFAKLPTNLGWRFMLGIGALPSIFLAVGVLFMPESPRWLVMQGRIGEARRVLEKTSDTLEEAKMRLADIKDAAGLSESYHDLEIISVPKRSRGEDVWKEIFLHPTPTVQHIMLVGVGVHFFQQASGIDAVVLYSPRIFEKAGLKTETDRLLATIAVGVSKTIFTLVSTFFLDKIGRRVLLLSSCGGMVICLIGLAIGLTVIDQYPDEQLTWAIALCILMTLLAVAFFSSGMGPIAWVYSSEIFPLRLRAQGCGMGVAMNRFISGVILMSFISLYQSITIGGAFFLFAGVGIIAWIFFYTLLPETRGRNLEDMEVLFGSFCRWRSTSNALEEKKKRMEGDFYGLPKPQ